MNDEPKQQARARQERLRAALRENLKRRKTQARGRVGEAKSSGESEEQADRGDGAHPKSRKT